MLDSDLAELYGVKTERLIQQVHRNPARFPEKFAFRLTREEFSNLTLQFARSRSWGGRRTLPYVFTEHGAVMLSSVLRTDQAVRMSILVVEAFVYLREILSTHRELARKIEELEGKLGVHDEAIIGLFEAIRQLMESPEEKRKPIGFISDKEE
ncbi:MAG: ORF6N domain-containing protein [Nitrospirae bacterium]|nr:ORF6N domain-containing protein [Nitrospirota bacterium]